MLLALKEDPSLMTLVLTLLEQLVQRRVWESRDVWRGYVLCCYETRPRSLPVLASLPPQQIADAIAVQPRLAEPMMRLCKARGRGGHTQPRTAPRSWLVAVWRVPMTFSAMVSSS